MVNQDGVAADRFANPLPGVPLVESPFFERFFNDAQTPPEVLKIAKQLRDVGYAVIDFPDEDFNAVADSIVHDMARYFSDPSIPRQAVREDSTRVQDAWEFHPLVKRLATNEKIRELLTSLYGRTAWPFQTLNFRYGSQQNYHTDAVHFSSIPERFMCGVWIALEDIELEAGPLVYYPGTHRWPIYANEHIGYEAATGASVNQGIYHALWESLVELYQIKPQRFIAKKGQALIWAANLLHGGEPRINPQLTRWSQVTHYYFDDCLYYTPMLSDPGRGQIQYREPMNIVTGERLLSPDRLVANPVDRLTENQFDAAAYLIANPDVQAAGVNAYSHYLEYGRQEGRRLR